MQRTINTEDQDIIADTTHLRKLGNSLGVVIPKCIRDSLKWAEGETLLVRVHENSAVITPLLLAMVESVNKYGQEFRTKR
jgi:AbrB family looped-hinge helix DNA binding protein